MHCLILSTTLETILFLPFWVLFWLLWAIYSLFCPLWAINSLSARFERFIPVLSLWRLADWAIPPLSLSFLTFRARVSSKQKAMDLVLRLLLLSLCSHDHSLFICSHYIITTTALHLLLSRRITYIITTQHCIYCSRDESLMHLLLYDMPLLVTFYCSAVFSFMRRCSSPVVSISLLEVTLWSYLISCLQLKSIRCLILTFFVLLALI